jgi:WD40 repeat protein
MFTADGKTLITASGDGLVRLWDTASAKERRRLAGHRYGVLSLALSPDGKTLVSGGAGHAVGFWDLAGGRPVRLVEGSHGDVLAVAFSPGGQPLAAAFQNLCL